MFLGNSFFFFNDDASNCSVGVVMGWDGPFSVRCSYVKARLFQFSLLSPVRTQLYKSPFFSSRSFRPLIFVLEISRPTLLRILFWNWIHQKKKTHTFEVSIHSNRFVLFPLPLLLWYYPPSLIICIEPYNKLFFPILGFFFLWKLYGLRHLIFCEVVFFVFVFVLSFSRIFYSGI